MAVIESSPAPLLLLDGELRVVGASLSFCDAFGIDPATAQGRSLCELGSGEWDDPSLRDLLAAIASGTPQVVALEMELERPGLEPRCLIINARLLAYWDLAHPRLLVAVADVTDARADARAKDEAVERLAVLLREVRHRVANSLQIVSAVLLQNARRTNSAEARDSLADAHRRIMSVAALERQLSASADGDQRVELRTYFTSLCENIAASLIGDQNTVSLSITGGGVVTARVSVSLGLIVTELVMNALKHAFPNGRTGRIEIGYQAHGPNWTLSVRDDGVGIPNDAGPVRTGIGTGVVQALARQLRATVEIAPAAPGTLVCIEHVQVALVAKDADPARARRGKTILIVEDEALVAIALRDELEGAGFDVLDLTDRHDEAVVVARESAPDLALVNIQLGGRDDGIELASHLKKLDIPVLLISGQVSRAQSAKTVAIGSMPKPYSAPEMVVAVTYLLAQLRGDESPAQPAGLEVFEAIKRAAAPAG